MSSHALSELQLREGIFCFCRIGVAAPGRLIFDFFYVIDAKREVVLPICVTGYVRLASFDIHDPFCVLFCCRISLFVTLFPAVFTHILAKRSFFFLEGIYSLLPFEILVKEFLGFFSPDLLFLAIEIQVANPVRND